MTQTPGLDREWLLAAIDLSRQCPAVTTAYSVGAIIISRDGHELARGYSRETDPHIHAEESALDKLTHTGTNLAGATIYSSLEPCSTRRSRPTTCTQLILATNIRRVVFALPEPPTFAECHGAELLRDAGLDVIEISDLAPLVREINVHVLHAQGQRKTGTDGTDNPRPPR